MLVKSYIKEAAAMTGFLFVLLFTSLTKPDDIISLLSQQLGNYISSNPRTNLFLHLDKNVYAPNEDIWFKAYVLSAEAAESKVLYVRLTDEKKRVIIAQQFPMYDIRAHGDIMLPDTLKDGNYYVFAYTDRMINFSDQDAFVQPIKVIKNHEKKLELEASVIDTLKLKRGGQVEMMVRVKEGTTLLKNIRGEYKLVVNGKVNKSIRMTTNTFGEALMSFIYPDIPDNESLKVRVNFSRGDDSPSLELNLRHEGNVISAKFFPEGGHLLAGIENNLIIKTHDLTQTAVSTEAIFFEGKKEVLRIKTNKMGMGKCVFTPNPNATYTLEIHENDKLFTYNLPPIEAHGFGLHVAKQRNRTIASITNVGENENVLLVLRSVDRILWSKQINIAQNRPLIIPFNLDSLPRDVVSLTVFDNSGIPRAERLFFNKTSETYSVSIHTDLSGYGLRKKVTVTAQVIDTHGKPIEANFSIAAVEKSTIDSATCRTILDTYYYKYLYSGDFSKLLAFANEGQIDEMLLTKSWQNVDWKDVLAHKNNQPIALLDNTDGVSGVIQPLTKKPFDVKNLVLLSKSGVFTTDVKADHSFSIPSENLISKDGNKWYLIQNPDFNTRYKINYSNYDLEFDKRIVSGAVMDIPRRFNSYSSNQPMIAAASKGIIELKEVKISANSSSNGIAEFKSKTCNDWVCMYNILNCKNHPTGTAPQEGAVYHFNNGSSVIYHDCEDHRNSFTIKNISLPKEFYLADYDKESFSAPEFHSTAYWNPNVNTGKEGKVTFSFFTSDVKGEFTIIAQGIDINTLRPMYGKSTFSAK